MPKRCCADCVFFEADHANRGGGTSNHVGLCRINPPSLPQTKASAGFWGSEAGLWPEVEENDWCGKFEEEIDPEVADFLNNHGQDD